MAIGLQISKETTGNTLTVHLIGDLNVKTFAVLESVGKV